MDLDTAINLSNKYTDYTNTEVRDHDLNQTVMNRVFDVGPLSTHNVHNRTGCPTPNSYIHRYSQADVCPPQIDPIRSMSREYLQMKHAQEKESLMENPSCNPIAIQQLNQRQSDETHAIADQIQMNHANKYKNLKYMSPEMLNKSYGRQPCQSVLPIPTQTGSNDVYAQTACSQKQYINVSRQLKQDLTMRQQQILTQKSKNDQLGTNLDEAYGGSV